MKDQMECTKLLLQRRYSHLWPIPKRWKTLAGISSSCCSQYEVCLTTGEYKDRRLVYFNNSKEAAKNKKELARIISEIIKTIDKK
jgi:hypothetical protein